MSEVKSIENKNILFISPEFFGIDKSIKRVLKEMGANVFWVDERSVKSSFTRALNSISSQLFYFQSNNYYKKIVLSIECKIDIILVIKGEMITKKTIKLIRERFPKAELLLYLYDPIKNIKGILRKTKLYDRVISFEPDDCKKYGFEFRALFCDIEKAGKMKKKYDICFYGTMYGDRFQIVQQMHDICKKDKIEFYSFCFLRGKFMAVYYWIVNAAFRKMGIRSISFEPKSSEEIAELVYSSDVILDVNDVRQHGLTIRTLETLLSGKKMITTNSDIIEYDFYNPNNIYVIQRNKIELPHAFFKTEYEEIEATILAKYTAEGWVRDVFRIQ